MQNSIVKSNEAGNVVFPLVAKRVNEAPNMENKELVVMFFSGRKGIVLVCNNTPHLKVGEILDDFTSCFDRETWVIQDMTISFRNQYKA